MASAGALVGLYEEGTRWKADKAHGTVHGDRQKHAAVEDKRCRFGGDEMEGEAPLEVQEVRHYARLVAAVAGLVAETGGRLKCPKVVVWMEAAVQHMLVWESGEVIAEVLAEQISIALGPHRRRYLALSSSDTSGISRLLTS